MSGPSHNAEYRMDLLERCILATREALTETARRDVHIYLSCELDELDAAEVWHQLALAPIDTSGVAAR